VLSGGVSSNCRDYQSLASICTECKKTLSLLNAQNNWSLYEVFWEVIQHSSIFFNRGKMHLAASDFMAVIYTSQTTLADF
jgi:hypothetical protein